MNRRNTIQRDIIKETLLKLDHPTAEDVHQEIVRTYPDFSIATVYRNLRQMSESGEIQKLLTGSNADHFDFNIDKHYHLKCLKCNKVSDVLVEYQKELDIQVNNPKIKIYEHQLVFIGLCEECNKAKEMS